MLRMPRARRGREEGSIFQRKDGLWVGRISLGYDAAGNRKRVTFYGKTKRETQAKLTKMQQDALVGKPLQTERIRVSQHFSDWLQGKRAGVKSSTYQKYEAIVRAHINSGLGHTWLKDLDYRRVNAFYDSLYTKEPALAQSTIYEIAAILRRGLEDAVRKGLIPVNPAKLAAKQGKGEKEALFLNHQELADFLLAAKNERLENAFILAINTGLRPGEWLGLTWDAVDLTQGYLTVKQSLHEENGRLFIGDVKTKAGRRTISLNSEATQALRRQHKRQLEEKLVLKGYWSNELNLVFTNTKGGPLHRTNIAKRDMKCILSRATLISVAHRNNVSLDEITTLNPKLVSVIPGTEVTLPNSRIDIIKETDIFPDICLHAFRHTHASMLIAAGVDIKTISCRLGHENINITLQTYGHLLPGQDERAAEMMDVIMANLPKPRAE